MTNQDIAETLKVLIDDLHSIVFFLNKIQQEMIGRERMKDE